MEKDKVAEARPSSPTETSQVQAEKGPGPVWSGSPLPLPLTKNGPDAGGKAARRGAVYRLIVERGMAARQVAKHLKLPWTTVNRNVASLLEMGAIRPIGGAKTPPRSVQLYERGPLASEFEAGLVQSGPVHRSSGPLAAWSEKPASGPFSGPPPALMHLHRGRVTIDVLRAPADLAAAPGLVKGPWKRGTTTHALYAWSGGEGRWQFQLNLGASGRASLTVMPPAVETRDPETTRTADQWWPDRASKAAHSWAATAGFLLERDRSKVRLSSPIEKALPEAGIFPSPQGTPGKGQLWVDGTPRAGTLEGTEGDMIAGLAVAPAQIVALQRDLASVKGEQSVMRGGLQAVKEASDATHESSKLILDILSTHTKTLSNLTLAAGAQVPQPPAVAAPLRVPRPEGEFV